MAVTARRREPVAAALALTEPEARRRLGRHGPNELPFRTRPIRSAIRPTASVVRRGVAARILIRAGSEPLLGALAVLALVIYLLAAHAAVGTTALGPALAGLAVALALVPALAAEAAKAALRRG